MADGKSWNAIMRKAEKLAIRLIVPLVLWPTWTHYQIRRFRDVYCPKFWEERKRKALWRCILELVALLVKWRCIPYHYFRHMLYSTDVTFKEVFQYLPESVFYYRVLPRWRLDACQLDDKIVFAAIAKASGLPVPETILVVRNGTIATGSGRMVADETQLDHVFAKVKAERVYLKPAMCGSGGRGILIFQRSGEHFYHGANKLSLCVLQELASSDWIIQEEVEQTTQLERIFPGSINTFKVTTALQNNTPRIMRCVLRFGMGSCQIDNLHSGGLLVNVDTTTGQLSERAIDADLNEYSKHPDTGVVFGTECFFIKPILDLARRAAISFSCVPVAGWDIALSNTGPVLIEGNSSPDIGTVQRFGGVAMFIK